MVSSAPAGQGGSMHFSFSTRGMRGHFLRPIRSLNRLVLLLNPIPHVEEHSDHWPHSVVSQKALLTGIKSPSAGSSPSPLKSNLRRTFPGAVGIRIIATSSCKEVRRDSRTLRNGSDAHLLGNQLPVAVEHPRFLRHQVGPGAHP